MVIVKKLRDLRKEVINIGVDIGAGSALLPSFGYSTQDGRPHIEVIEGSYHYVVEERGVEFSREVYECKEELLYRVFQEVAFGMAVDYEFDNRIAGQDPRRLIYKRQFELLGGVSEEWGRRVLEHHAEVLARRPMRD